MPSSSKGTEDAGEVPDELAVERGTLGLLLASKQEVAALAQVEQLLAGKQGAWAEGGSGEPSQCTCSPTSPPAHPPAPQTTAARTRPPPAAPQPLLAKMPARLARAFCVVRLCGTSSRELTTCVRWMVWRTQGKEAAPPPSWCRCALLGAAIGARFCCPCFRPPSRPPNHPVCILLPAAGRRDGGRTAAHLACQVNGELRAWDGMALASSACMTACSSPICFLLCLALTCSHPRSPPLHSVSGINPLQGAVWGAAGEAEVQHLKDWMRERGEVMSLAEVREASDRLAVAGWLAGS